MAASTLKLLSAILSIGIVILISYWVSVRYSIGFIPLASFLLLTLGTIFAAYEFVNSHYEEGKSSKRNREETQDSQKTKSEDRHGPESSFKGSTNIGRDFQVGERTEIREVHLHNNSNSANEDQVAEDNIPDPSTELDEIKRNPIPEAVVGGSLKEVNYTPVEREFGLSPITFRNPLFSGHNVHSFKNMMARDISFDEFKEALSKIVPLLWGSDSAAFAISQEDGQWYGYGLTHFIEALSEPKARYDRDYTGRVHGNEAAVCLLGVEDGGLLAIGCQPITPSDANMNRTNPTRKLSIGFLTSGTPVDTTPYQKIAQAFNTKMTGGITESKAYVAQIAPNTKTKPLDFISIDRGTNFAGEWADYAIIRNPFDQYPELKEDLQFSYQNGESIDEQYWNKPRQMAAACEYVPVNITAGMEPNTDLYDIVVNRINVTCYTGLTSGHGHYNIEISGTDTDAQNINH